MSWPMVELKKLIFKVDMWNPVKDGRDDQITYIDLSSIDKNSKAIKNEDVQKIQASLAPSRARQLVDSADILVATVRPNLNGVALVPSDYQGATASTGYCVLRPNNKLLDSKYLFYWVQTESFISDMMAKATGANYPAVSDKIVKESQIPLPPLDEQKRIAAILDKADAIRQKRKQAIALADEFLRSVFLDMFGTDLVRDKNRVQFGDVTILDAKMVDPREDEYLDLLHIGPDRIQKNTGKLLPALTAREEGLISKKFFFNSEYVLYSKIRPYLRKAAIPDFSALCSADMYPVKPIEGKATREFIWMLLLSDLFDTYVASLPDRANIPKLNKKELAAFEFSLPDYRKITKFSQIVKQHNKSLYSMELAVQIDETSFNALSQKAFSGQL
ncbi:restriction endonuclease subunit S [Vibrio misgurnus]|uniref:restriction endonuclease subunit S n=1 Tax=Vibrio misgurnus TaxID=2993714 RepID=UPI0023F867B2|nr:restriction endonuclease subunit S [Vibrio sp. VCS]